MHTKRHTAAAAWRAGLVTVGLTLQMGLLAARGAPPPRASAALNGPFLRAAAASVAPVLDGKADDAVWQQALVAGPFVSLDGTRLAEPQTRVWLATETKTLHVLVACAEPLLDPVIQRTHEVKADVVAADGPVSQDDCVEILLQPGGPAAPYFHFAVNPRGTLYDALWTAGRPDPAWASQARVAVARGARAWTVELAVPFAALGGAPALDAIWGLNLARHRSTDNAWSCWSPSGESLHQPERFGSLGFGAPPVGMAELQAPGFEEGPQHWRLTLRTPQPLTAVALSRHGEFPWSAVATTIAPQDVEQAARVALSWSRRNSCIRLEAPAAKDPETLCFRTDRLTVTPGARYRLAARVRAEALTGGTRPLVLAISAYGADDKALQTYQPVLPVPVGTYDWRDLEAEWQAPEKAVGILFWVVKWAASGVSGQVWFDDLRLGPADSSVNLLPNGAVEVQSESPVTGWNLFAGSSLQESYPHGSTVRTALEVHDERGALLLRAGPFAGEVTPRLTAISAVLMLTASQGESASVLRLKELYVNEGGVLDLPLVLRSSQPERYAWADVVLTVPECLHLLPPEPRAEILERHLAGDRRTYRVRFPAGALSPMEGTKQDVRVTHLLAECGVMTAAERRLTLHLNGAVEGAAEEPMAIPLHILPPLGWTRPHQVPITNWACSTFYRPFGTLNRREQDAIAHLWRQAGFNRTGTGLDAERRERYGFSARGHVPLITGGSNFPQGAEYLEAHPEARALDFAGRVQASTFCPTYFLDPANGHLPQVAAWLAEQARAHPHLDWDYEVPVTRDASICACDRCLAAFRQVQGLADPAAVSRASVRQTHRQQWVEWRCRENARLAASFRASIKAANPACLFSIYSGYQGDTDERYGVDWRSMALPADLVWAGYGRPREAIAATHAAIGGRPFICGLLAWYGAQPWDNGGAQLDVLRCLADGGSGIMTYFNWVVDGRFYRAVSRAAAITADFEAFFRWDIAGDGTYHSRYQRADDLVEVSGEGKAEDVLVLHHGQDRLLFVCNATAGPRRVALRHVDWREGMACIDAESGEVSAATHEVVLPAREVRVLHVRPPGPVTVEAPRLLSAREGLPVRDVILAWQGQGSQPGDQVFEVQFSPTADFAPATTTVRPGLATTAWAATALPPGHSAWWRVRGADALTGIPGPWSEVVRVVRSPLSEPPPPTAAFSPNGDGVLDEYVLSAELAADLPWSVSITAADGKEQCRLEGQGRALRLAWDGRAADGTRLPAGTYRSAIRAGALPEPAWTGTVEINPRVGVPNPGLDRCPNFILTVPSGKAHLVRDYQVSVGNSYALAIHADAPGSSAYWSNYAGGGIVSPPLPVTPGQSYRFAARLRTALRQGEAMIALTFFSATGHWAGVPGKKPSGVPSAAVTGETEWTPREVVLTAPAEAASAVLFFSVKDAVGTSWFDDVSFGEAPPDPNR